MTYQELIRMLRTATSARQIDAKKNEIAKFLPQCTRMIGYDQNHPNHPYDLWGHCVHTVIALPRNLEDDVLYLAALLHDIGKPDCRTNIQPGDDLGKMYHGHPQKSADIVMAEVVPELRKKGCQLLATELDKLYFYIAHHDDHLDCALPEVLDSLRNCDKEQACNLLRLEIADSKAHKLVPIMEKRIEVCNQAIEWISSGSDWKMM